MNPTVVSVLLVLVAFTAQANLCPKTFALKNEDKNTLLKGDGLEIEGKVLTSSKDELANLPTQRISSWSTLNLANETSDNDFSTCEYTFAKGPIKTGLIKGRVILNAHETKKLENATFGIPHTNNAVIQITTMSLLSKVLAQEIPEHELKTTAICFDFDSTLADLLNPQAQPSQYVYEAVEPSNQAIVKTLKAKAGFVGVCSADSLEGGDKNKVAFLAAADIQPNDYVAGYQDKFQGLQALLARNPNLPPMKNYVLVDDSSGKIALFAKNPTPEGRGKVIGVLYRAIRSR